MGALIELTRSTVSGEARSAIRALGEIGGSEEAAQALGPLLADKEHRVNAKHAMQKMGKFAEEPALVHVGASDNQTHRCACEVIGDVGGEQSLQKLKSLPNDSDEYRRALINVTIQRIETRLGKS